MATIAIRVPTLTPAGESLPSGHCYLMLPPTITLRDLIAEKIGAEHRKARAAGIEHSTLEELSGMDCEQWATYANNAIKRFEDGAFSVLVDGQLVSDLDAPIAITRRTSIAFIVADPVLA